MKKYNHSNECGGGFVSLNGKIRSALAQDFSIQPLAMRPHGRQMGRKGITLKLTQITGDWIRLA
jgi:hypothetical protein